MQEGSRGQLLGGCAAGACQAADEGVQGRRKDAALHRCGPGEANGPHAACPHQRELLTRSPFFCPINFASRPKSLGQASTGRSRHSNHSTDCHPLNSHPCSTGFVQSVTCKKLINTMQKCHKPLPILPLCGRTCSNILQELEKSGRTMGKKGGERGGGGEDTHRQAIET